VVTATVGTKEASRLTNSKDRFVSRKLKAGQNYCIKVEERGLWKSGNVQIFGNNPNKWKLSGMRRASPDKIEGMFKFATYIAVILHFLCKCMVL